MRGMTTSPLAAVFSERPDARRRYPEVAKILDGLPALAGAKWPDEGLREIDTEDLAREAYRYSSPLRNEFETAERFISYWKRLRR